jgi:hypothetical protein
MLQKLNLIFHVCGHASYRPLLLNKFRFDILQYDQHIEIY